MRAALWRALTPSSCRTAASLPVCGNVITFCLKHNQSAVVEGLPEGFTYELIEEAGSGCLTGIFDSVTEDVNGSITVVDVVNLSKVDITVEKQWNKDDDIAINRRPDSITINLMNGEDVVDTAVVKPGENGKWTHTFTDLPEYDAKGSKIACTVEKEPGKGYAGTAE